MKFFIFVFFFWFPIIHIVVVVLVPLLVISEAASRVFIDHTKNLLFSEYQIKMMLVERKVVPLKSAVFFLFELLK